MVKHKPKPKTDVKINGVVYKCNPVTGIVELPDFYPMFNPVDKPKKKKVKEEE